MKRYFILLIAFVMVFVYLTAVLCVRQAAAAPITTLFNTGVNNDGTVRSHGDTDLHYTITSGPVTGAPFVRTSTGGFPIRIPTGPWIEDNLSSTWIVPNFDTDGGGLLTSPPGTYIYQTTFDLTGFDQNTASITGQWGTDDGSASLFLNGINTGIVSGSFRLWVPFSINSNFISGINTLEFHVNNYNVLSGNPSGLRVEMSGTADPIPEPATFALLGIGLVGFAGVGVKRRFKRAKNINKGSN